MGPYGGPLCSHCCSSLLDSVDDQAASISKQTDLSLVGECPGGLGDRPKNCPLSSHSHGGGPQGHHQALRSFKQG